MSCDVSINQLHLIDLDIGYFNAAMRLMPPLRQQRDRDAIRAALADGTIDALVSDHTPVDADAKNLPFAEAEPGATGLELLLSLALKWGAKCRAGAAVDAGARHQRPGAGARRCRARIAGGGAGRPVGGVADLCVFDPGAGGPSRPRACAASASTRRSPATSCRGGSASPLVAGQVAFEAA